MRFRLGVCWLCVGIGVPGALLAQPQASGAPTPALRPTDWGARVRVQYFDSSDRGVGHYSTQRYEGCERLRLNNGSFELSFAGRITSAGATLTPAGPSGARHHETVSEITLGGVVHRRPHGFDLEVRTFVGRAVRSSIRFECHGAVASLRCQTSAPLAHFGEHRWVPNVFRVPLILHRGQWVDVNAHGRSGSLGTAAFL